MKLLAGILVVAVALPLFAGSVQQVSMRAQDWRVWGWGGFKQIYSLSSQATGLYFTFPEGNTSAVNYMYQPRKAPIAGSAKAEGSMYWIFWFPANTVWGYEIVPRRSGRLVALGNPLPP